MFGLFLNTPRINPLNGELNPICHLLALVGARHILHVSRVKVKWTPFFMLCMFGSGMYVLRSLVSCLQVCRRGPLSN